jgi:hypothetical protein
VFFVKQFAARICFTEDMYVSDSFQPAHVPERVIYYWLDRASGGALDPHDSKKVNEIDSDQKTSHQTRNLAVPDQSQKQQMS